MVKPLYNNTQLQWNIYTYYSIYRILFTFRVFFFIHSEHTQFSINALSIHPFIYLSIYLSECVYICLSVCLYVCICVFDISENPITPQERYGVVNGNVEPITELGPKVVG